MDPELRERIDAHLVTRRKRTGENLTISEWIREAAEEKLAAEIAAFFDEDTQAR